MRPGGIRTVDWPEHRPAQDGEGRDESHEEDELGRERHGHSISSTGGPNGRPTRTGRAAGPPRSPPPTALPAAPSRGTPAIDAAPAYVQAERTPEVIESSRSSTPGRSGSMYIRECEIPSSNMAFRARSKADSSEVRLRTARAEAIPKLTL